MEGNIGKQKKNVRKGMQYELSKKSCGVCIYASSYIVTCTSLANTLITVIFLATIATMGCCFSCKCCLCCCKNNDDNDALTNIDFPQARRQRLAKKQYCGPNVKIEEEYVEMMDGNMIFTRCYIPTSSYNNNNNEDNNNINTDNSNTSNDEEQELKINGMICYNHGYSDHVDNVVHDTAIEFSSKRGYIVFVHEHYGHGRSDGKYIYCPDFNMMVKHASYVHKRAKLKYSKRYNIPKTGYFLGGHSMGGAIAIHEHLYDKQLKSKVKDKVKVKVQVKSKSAEQVQLNEKSHLLDKKKEKAKEKEKDLLEIRYINNGTINNIDELEIESLGVPEYNGMFLAAPMCGIGNESNKAPDCLETIIRSCILPCIKDDARLCGKGNENAVDDLLLSKKASESVQHRFFNDNPLRNSKQPILRTGISLMDATKFIQSNAHLVDIPLFVIHGKDDKITDPMQSKAFVEKAASKDKTHKLYDQGYHVIFHDCSSKQAFNEVGEFLARRANTNTGEALAIAKK